MKQHAAVRLIGAILVLGAVATPAVLARAEQSSVSGKGLVFDANRLHQGADTPAFAPASPSKQTAQRLSEDNSKNSSKPQNINPENAKSANPKPQSAKKGANPPSLSDHLNEPHRAAAHPRQPATIKESNVPLGRIPLATGTFGFDTDTRLKAREFPDGRRLPAYETLKREGGVPFIGLSLSVPTSSIPGFAPPSRSPD